MKSPSLVDPEQTPFYVKSTQLGVPIKQFTISNFKSFTRPHSLNSLGKTKSYANEIGKHLVKRKQVLNKSLKLCVEYS